MSKFSKANLEQAKGLKDKSADYIDAAAQLLYQSIMMDKTVLPEHGLTEREYLDYETDILYKSIQTSVVMTNYKTGAVLTSKATGKPLYYRKEPAEIIAIIERDYLDGYTPEEIQALASKKRKSISEYEAKKQEAEDLAAAAVEDLMKSTEYANSSTFKEARIMDQITDAENAVKSLNLQLDKQPGRKSLLIALDFQQERLVKLFNELRGIQKDAGDLPTVKTRKA